MDTIKGLSSASMSAQITRDYNIIKPLGKGGMGEVYLAEQLRVGRRLVALKVLNRSCSEDPEVIRRFENEAASAGRINHRNVVTVYESRVSEDGQLYVAMEFVEGQSLRDVIADEGPLSVEETVAITKQICAGLAAAHKLGIVHRDIKPDNIMINSDEDGSLIAKVLDFGIARLSEPGAEGSQTKTGVVMGTPYYMSPEQAMGVTGERIDARSDIYSLGMVVYQMLTGKVAFESDSWMRVMYMHINEPPVRPSSLRPELASFSELESVVLDALAKDREDRPQTVSEFASEIDAAYAVAKSRDARDSGTAIYSRTVMASKPQFAATLMRGATDTPATSSADRGTASAAAPQTYKEATAGKQAAVAESTAAPQRFSTRVKAVAALAFAAALIVAIVLFVLNRPAGEKANPAAAASAPLPRPAGPPSLEVMDFDVLGVGASGQLSLLKRAQAKFFSEDLGGATIEMVEIPGGEFLMGSPESEAEREANEGPQHPVKIAPFYMGKYEVTQAQWAAVVKLPKVRHDLDPNPSAFKGDSKSPVQNVTWAEAMEFCERLTRHSGRKYRLPSEAEWEYACRAGTKTPFHFGQNITTEVANYDGRYNYAGGPKGMTRRQPVTVGSLGSPNVFGLQAMHGNVAEWCLDTWHDNYIGAPIDGAAWTEGGEQGFRVLRSGSWYDGAATCRAATRERERPETRTGLIGLRVVMVPHVN